MKFQLFQKRSLGRGWQWRWRLRADNGRIIAASAEGYFNRADAEAGIALVRGTGPLTEVETVPRFKPAPYFRRLPTGGLPGAGPKGGNPR